MFQIETRAGYYCARTGKTETVRPVSRKHIKTVINSGIEMQLKKQLCALAISMVFGANAESALNPAGIKTPHTWKEVEALGVKKKLGSRGVLSSIVEFDLSNIRNCWNRVLTVTYVDASKKPPIVLSVPVAEINGKYKFTAPEEYQKQIVIGLKCHDKSYSFVLIE